MIRERDDLEVEMYECECCGDRFESDEDFDDDYCEACAYERVIEAAADRRYRRAESGYPDA